MPPSDLTTLGTPQMLADGHFRAQLPDGWQQGRGAFGGLVISLLTRAIERCAAARLPEGNRDRDRPLRSLSATLPLLYTARSPMAHGGYLLELRELWTAPIALVALNQQTFAVIK